MSREAQIPLFLWVAAAVVTHLLWGGGADKAARVIEEKIEIREFAASVRRFVRGEGKPIEIALLDEENAPKEADPDAPEQPTTDEPVDPDQKSAEKDDSPPDKRKVPPPDVKKEEEQKRPPEEKKTEEEKKKEEEKKTDAEKAPDAPAAPLDKKVAVKQHVADETQKDNPDAKFIAEHANHVDEETQAKITATDQDDPKPTPGGAAQSSNDPSDPGDAEKTRILQSDDHAGAQDRAPSERMAPTELRIAEQAPRSLAAAAAQAKLDGVKNGSPKSNSASRLPAEAGQAAQPALHAADAMPETLDSSRGAYEIARQKEASIEQQGRQARKRRELPPLRSSGIQGLLGLGATGTSPGGLNLNLSPQIAVASIGKDTLARERVADGERRRSEHAGHWRPSGIERWRAAIENYVPSVKPGNQTALNTAASPFATYLNQVHNRIHPLFADSFLASLDSLPASNPMNRSPDMYTSLEIVLDREQGRIQHMGVTHTSGVTAFDVSALDAVDRAQPFGAPPAAIVSPDGNVYFHWEFHRDANACGTANARPYMLKVQPKSAPPPLVPTTPPEEGQERHGSLRPRRAPLGEAPRPLAFIP